MTTDVMCCLCSARSKQQAEGGPTAAQSRIKRSSSVRGSGGSLILIGCSAMCVHSW